MVKAELIKRVHSQDIKECAVHNGLVFSAGRDGKVRVSREDTLEQLFETANLGSFANALCIRDDQLYVGTQSGTIWVFRISGTELHQHFQLKEHTENVCCLRRYQQRVVSASWDGRVCIWENDRLVDAVKTDKSVWAADILPNGKETLVAGCTDGSLVYFEHSNGKYQLTKGLAIHQSCIRDLLVEDDRLVSLSNTGVVLASEYSGRVINKVDLDAISFKITAWPETKQYLVASDEGIVRVLDTNLEVQYTITLPALSCWLAVPAQEKVLICGSDGRLYRFGSEGNPKAEQELNTIHDELQTAKSSTTATTEPKYKVTDGKVYEKKGDTWELFGDTVTPERKDHTIDIELGSRMFKLSFNKTDNYSEVAQQFVKEHQLGVEYIPEIVEFLETNFKQKQQRNTSEYLVYSTISLDGVRKKLAQLPHAATVLAFLEEVNQGKVSSASAVFAEKAAEIEVVLSEWLEEADEKFPILDCYKYLVSKHASFDFRFMKTLNVLDNKKDALLYMKLSTNLLAFSPEDKQYFSAMVNRIVDKGLASEEAIRHYKKNLYLADE